MLALKLLATFLCLMVVCESIDPTQITGRLHPAIFFSYKPALSDKLGDTIDTAKVTLTCVGGSKDGRRIEYKWYKNGKLMKADSSPIVATISGQLNINPSDYTRDDGFYQCMVTDTTWSLLSNMAELRLAYVNGIKKADVTSNVVQYQGWKYIYKGYSHSKIYPNLKPKFIWKYNGGTLKETERISISEDGNLYIAQLSLNDAGKYSCEMQLKTLRQQRESINLQVSRSLSTSTIFGTVMLGPKSKRVSLKREKEVTFECFVTGKPMPTIVWKKERRNLIDGPKYAMGDHNKRLTIKNLNKGDSGKYICTITNAASLLFPEATLTVIDYPVVKALEPANQVRHVGNYTTLTCMVTGTFTNVKFAQSWYRNGVLLSQSSKISMKYKTYKNYRNYTLNVTKLHQDTDGGMYQCFARSDGGEDMAYIAVNVLSMPPYITYGPGVVYAVLGRRAKIECIARGSPPITYTWQKNGFDIKNLDPSDNGNNGTYIIKNVQRGDVAQYTCIASNGKSLGDMRRSTGRLELVSPTVVVNKSITVYASIGSYPYLYCGVRYDKKVNVTYRWYFKGATVDARWQKIESNSRREVAKDGRLVIRGVDISHNGIYRCESKSAVGDYSTTIKLVVQAPPLVPWVPQIDNIRPDSVRLLWRAGYDGNSAIWHFNIGYKFPANGTVVEIAKISYASGAIKKDEVPKLIPYTRYQFRIQAVNSVGVSPWSGYSAEIRTLEAAPSYKLKQVKGTVLKDNTVDVTWEEPPRSTHNGILRGYYVAWKYAGVSSGSFTTQKVTPATTRKLKITNLLLNAPYDVKIQMFNDAGAGPFSDPILVKTNEEPPSRPPRNLAVRNVSSRSVVLEWDEPPQQYWNGDIKHYIIRYWVLDKEDKFDRVAQRDPSAFIQVFNVTNLKTYTQYTFKVSAQNGDGQSPYSKTVQVRTTEDIPSAPQGLQIVDQFSDTISVKWVRPREVNGVLTGYIVKYWRVSRPDDVKTQDIGGKALQTGITSLLANTRYTIQVAAKTNAGVSKSARIDGTTQNVAEPPKPPTDLGFVEINATRIELTWKEGWKGNSPIIKYIIEGNNETGFAEDRTSKWFDALVVNDPFKIFNLPPVIIEYLRPATTYRFRVKAYNKVGSSAFSVRSRDVTTFQAAPWSPPLNIQVKPAQYPGELTLTWEIPPVETWNSPFISYTLVLQEVGDITNETRYITSGIRGITRRFKLFALSKFTKYEIKMKTVNHIGHSRYSPLIIGQTLEYVPETAPANIRAIGLSASSINITWSEVPKKGRNGFILGYKMFYRLVQYAPHDFNEIILGDVREYILKKLLKYTQYDIRILAYTKIGDGKISDELKPYPRTLESWPGPPSNLRFPRITTTVVVVTWDPPELTGGNITQYRVSYKLGDDGKLVNRPALAATKESDSITNLSPNKFYTFEVQAYTDVGWGEKASAVIYTSQERSSDKPERPIILPISNSHITWRSITVRWAVARRRNQPIRYFTLKFRKAQGAWETHPKPLSGADDELVVWGLASDHKYSFEITATNDAGTSLPSIPSPPVRTLRRSTPGSPREVRIISSSPTTFDVTWEAPSLIDAETTIKEYRLSYRLHENGPSSNPTYLVNNVVSSSTRSYQLTGLDEFTLYDIRLNAVNVNDQDMPYYLETRRTSAKLPRRPGLNTSPNVGPTSVTISWSTPSKTKTPVLGYKAVYEPPLRRRRAADDESCELPQPGEAYFSKTANKGTITGLQMFTHYTIVLRSFNTAGASPPSNAISVRTTEGVPSAPKTFGLDGVYDIEVQLYWIAPCQPNGVITKYILTVTTGARRVQKKDLSKNLREYRVVGLTPRTVYKFQLVARTSRGEGIPKVLEITTKTLPVKPLPPKIMRPTAEHNTVTLTWKDQFHGNTPITKYMIQYRTSSEKNPWNERWSLKPSETTKNRTDGTLWVVLSDLEPFTVYWFRMKVQNKVGLSPPSDSSESVTTGAAIPVARSAPIYEEIWFISVIAVIGFLILLLIILCICCLCCRRRRRSKALGYPLEVELQPSNGRPYSSIDETLSNGYESKTRRDEKPLVAELDSEQDEEEEDDASSLETKSELSESESEDDIPTKKGKMEAQLREQDKYFPPRSYSQDQLYNSPPPAYATFASTRDKGRSAPVLDPFADYDQDDDVTGKPYQLPYRPPTRRSEPYDGESSESSAVANRKRDDPRSSSFRRALFTAGGPSQPEPERPHQPERRPHPRKYRSLEKAVNENAKPPSYHDDDDDDDATSRQPSLPPEYRSDSGRDSSDDHERIPLTQASSHYNPRDRSESPAPAYHSDDSLSSDRHRLTERPTPQPEISTYSSFV